MLKFEKVVAHLLETGEPHWRMESGNFLVIDYLEKEGEMFLMLQAHPRAVVLLDSMMTE